MTIRDYRSCGHWMLSWKDCASCQQQRYREDRARERERRSRPAWSWKSLL